MGMSGSDARIYIDSNVFIYAVEGPVGIAELLQRLFDILRRRPGTAVTSELTLAEVLAKADAAGRRDYLDLIAESGVFELCIVSRDILIETATYRRTVGMAKLADAIHVVTAIRRDCAVLLSADMRIKVPEGITLMDANPNNISRLLSELS
jgi:predicted nucleic acid-binding protein